MIRTQIIAEAGVNHNGDLNLAKRLIKVAADAGADYVKFQTFKAEDLVTSNAKLANYQKKNSQSDANQYQMLKRLELTHTCYDELINHANLHGIKFLSSAFDIESLYFLNKLNLDLIKIPSGEITNLPYLIEVSATKKPIVLSTGMSTLGDIEAAIDVLCRNNVNLSSITLLHCTTEYPAPPEEVNLRAIDTLRTAFGVNVGYSDHTVGIQIPLAAVAMGASIIEKHFTLDQMMSGPDHKASINPKELKEMVSSIRLIERAFGDGIKRVTPSELSNITIARKSIVAKSYIKKGSIFTKENLSIKRPGGGISPMKINEILGGYAKKDFDIDQLIEI